MLIFNRSLVQTHRDRAAANFGQYNFLNRFVANDLAERISEYSKEYELALDLGCWQGELRAKACNIKNLIRADLSAKMLGLVEGERVQVDEEHLPFADNCFDLVMSSLNLHWVNDLPGALLQINRVLKPGGTFFAAIIGGKSLIELRKTLIEAEGALGHNVCSHLSPMIDAADLAALLQRAKFSKPVTDSLNLTITYPDLRSLMGDLQGMAQNNCLGDLPKLRRDTLALAENLYRKKYSEDGRIAASFEIVTMMGVK